MKKIIEKTKKEKEQEITYEEIVVKDTYFFYWVCDKCKIAFFSEDIILKGSDGVQRCPQKIKSLFGKKVCNNHIYGGHEESFNRYYKFAE